MVHAGMRSVGPIVGGVNVMVQALLDVAGTVAAYLDIEPFYEEGDPEVPVFDKRTAKAARDHGVLHETLRCWPGALRSDHPDAGVMAIGSGGNYALAAARALIDSDKDAETIVRRSLDIAADICVYTNRSLTIETLQAG